MPVIRSAYSPKKKVEIIFSGSGRTKQSFRDQCDVNRIMAKFTKTGILDFVQGQQPRYGDCTGYDYQHFQNVIAEANSRFYGLPAKVRGHFENSPAKFLDFVNDPTNHAKGVELGLWKAQSDAPSAAATPPAPPAPKASEATEAKPKA